MVDSGGVFGNKVWSSGQMGSEGTRWGSATSVMWKVGEGTRGTRRIIVMTVGDRSGSMNDLWSD